MIRLLARSISLLLVVVAGYFICRHGLAANFLFLFYFFLPPTFFFCSFVVPWFPVSLMIDQ